MVHRRHSIDQRIAPMKRLRVYDLRHTHASWMVTVGKALFVVHRRMGLESSTTTTGTSAHLVPGPAGRGRCRAGVG